MATYKVGADGKAQSGLKAGDQVVTAGGTYTITGVNADGSYKSELSNKGQTTNNYSGSYSSTPSTSSNKQTTSTGLSAPSTGSSQTSASTNAQKQTSAPTGYAGSSTGVGVHTDDQEAIKAQMNANSKAWYGASPEEQARLHAENERLAAMLGGSVGYDAQSGTWSGSAEKEPEPVQTPTAPQMPTVDPNAGQGLKDYLDAWLEAAKTQSGLQIDYATQKGVTDLQRAEEDAQQQFQTQRDQVSRDERVALDNSALYSEARGDRGGIGEAQYDLIMANAAKNRLAVNQAQTKLSTDTARQIADLRAQGEFQKADQLLQLTQTYLSQLMQLEQWGLEYALSATQFNAQMQQWMAEFELSVGELMGSYQGMPTLGAQKTNESKLAAAGETLLAAGIMPSSSQLAAMGMTSAQAQDYITAAKLAAAAKGSSGGSSSGGNKTMSLTTAKEMASEGRLTDEVLAVLRAAGYDDEYLKSKYNYNPSDTSLWSEEDKLASQQASTYLYRTDVRGWNRQQIYDDMYKQGFSVEAINSVLNSLGLTSDTQTVK